MFADLVEALAQVIRDDVASELATAGIDIEVEPFMVVEPSAPICIDMFSAPSARTSAGAGFGDIAGFYVLTLRARASANDGYEAQAVLRDMIDDAHALSLAAAVEADSSLDGYATSVAFDPEGFTGLEDFSTGKQLLVGCSWRLLVGVAQS